MRYFQRDGYHVLDWPEQPGLVLAELLKLCPEIVENRHLVNTSFDSGHLVLSDSEIKSGWTRQGRHAHSPRIISTRQIPHDQFDEWLVFETAVQVAEFKTMVNHSSFTPIDFLWKEKLECFWTQVKTLRPLHVLGENSGLYFVSRDFECIQKIKTIAPPKGIP